MSTLDARIPIDPEPEVIESMCYRYRHDFGLLDKEHREGIRVTMRQLYDTIARWYY